MSGGRSDSIDIVRVWEILRDDGPMPPEVNVWVGEAIEGKVEVEVLNRALRVPRGTTGDASAETT